MADRYTETRTQGYFSRIGSSVKGIVTGFLLFFLSFGVLYRNEGRVNLSKVADKAVEISSQTTNIGEHNGKLVAVSGELKAINPIGDTYLKEGSYLMLQRNVEVYAWKEKTSEKTEKNLGGSETTTTTYDYEKERQSNPSDSTKFRYPTGHENLPKTIEDNRVVAKDMTIGKFNVNDNIDLPPSENLALSEDIVLLQSGMTLGNGGHIYLPVDPTNTGGTVQIGDQRISYKYVQNPITNATAFGKLDGNDKISPYIGPKNTKLYRAFVGTKDEALVTMQNEYTFMLWIFRLAGFLMMWFGLTTILAPLTVVLDVVPAIGKLGSWAISIVTFIITLVLSLITIIISMILHNIWALIIVFLLVIGVTIYFFKKRKNSTIKSTEK